MAPSVVFAAVKSPWRMLPPELAAAAPAPEGLGPVATAGEGSPLALSAILWRPQCAVVGLCWSSQVLEQKDSVPPCVRLNCVSAQPTGILQQLVLVVVCGVARLLVVLGGTEQRVCVEGFCTV